jgi:hypothetical protein
MGIGPYQRSGFVRRRGAALVAAIVMMAIVGGTVSFLVIAAAQDRKQLQLVHMQQLAEASLDSGIAYVRVHGASLVEELNESTVELDAAGLVPPHYAARITLELKGEESDWVHVTSHIQRNDRRVIRETSYPLNP